MTPVWNSLEAAKLVASTLTPISVAVLGLFLGRAAKRFEARQWASQKVIEKRLIIYDAMSSPLNDLLCYFSRVGNWKEQSPLEVIAIKRRLDKQAYVYRWLFTTRWFDAYHAFIQGIFGTWSGEGHDARIRTDLEKHKAAWLKAGKQWDTTWDARFDTTRVLPIPSVQAAYDVLMGCFSYELGVGLPESRPAVETGNLSAKPPSQDGGQSSLPSLASTGSERNKPIPASSAPKPSVTVE